MKRTGMSNERLSTGGLGRPHLGGRYLEYERRKREGRDNAEEEMLCDIYVLRFFFGTG
jgi:hypothetical protein